MIKDSVTSKSKTQAEIFADMHRQLRAFNNEVPASPDRMDPIMRILMQLYAHQLERIDKRLDDVWDIATQALIRSMCPESMRWPVPAYSILKCEPVDPVVVVDPHTKFFYKEERDRGETFFFSSLRNEKLIHARPVKMYLRIDDTVIDLSPQSMEDMTSTSRIRTTFAGGKNYRIYLGVDYSGAPSELSGARLFLKGDKDVLKQLRWAHWYPGSNMGSTQEDCGFCPGLTSRIEHLFADEKLYVEWGGLRTSAELFKPLENHIVELPEIFSSAWELGPIDSTLKEIATKDGLNIDDSERLYWIRLDLPEGGDKTKLQSSFEINFNCFIVVNKNELTLFKHTGGNRLVEVELPEHIDTILEISGVTDSSGREYIPRHMAGTSKNQVYTPEEREGHLVLWFDFSSKLELPPDSITVNYAVTAGTTANGIEPGKITELYENHPGISSAINILPVSGAIPAKSDEQIMTEVAARLRNRDRTLSFDGIVRWARTFDSRILGAQCRNGVERMARGVRRCIVITLTIKKEEFFSDDERELLKLRLAEFLKARSPINTHYRVEISR
ncbi:MAG: hypothetical protein R3F48_16175 [Candidatus Zixiibacteriota bacterium]